MVCLFAPCCTSYLIADQNIPKKIMTMPIWDLPGIVKHFGIAEAQLRRALFEQTGGMLPELVTRSDLERFCHQLGA